MNRVLCLMLLSVLALILLGILMLDSASVVDSAPYRLYAHLTWLGLGTGCAFALAWIDYRNLRKVHLPSVLLSLSCLLLLALFVPGIGVLVNGARRWLPFGGQPSEFAKLAVVIWLADYGATHQPRMQERNLGFVWPGTVCGLTAGLIFLEPDWGTAFLVGSVSGALLLLAGTRWRYLLTAVALAVPFFVALVLINPVRLPRVISFVDPESFQEGIGWQGWHSVLSIGSGGIFGTFCGEGAHKFGFVPEQQTDFIFSLIGEELGLVGSTAVIVLFSTFTFCGIRIAWRIADSFGQLLASGISLLIGMQALVNLGVCTSSIPNKGIPLPFVSYGGSSLLGMLMAVGTLVSVARHAPLASKFAHVKHASALSKSGVPLRPHTSAAIRLAGALLHLRPTLRSNLVRWWCDARAARRPPSDLRRYQRTNCGKSSAANRSG